MIGLFTALALTMAGAFAGLAGDDDDATGPFAVDASNGLALDGYDPVSYFVAGEPRPGLRRFEVSWAGVVWRFASVGNRDAFIRAPEVYAPRFGGHGALAVSRGYPAQASPLYWVVHKDRLYLFFSPVNRLAWLEDPDRPIADAERKWTRLRKQIANF